MEYISFSELNAFFFHISSYLRKYAANISNKIITHVVIYSTYH